MENVKYRIKPVNADPTLIDVELQGTDYGVVHIVVDGAVVAGICRDGLNLYPLDGRHTKVERETRENHIGGKGEFMKVERMSYRHDSM